ncbi:MAG TPA: hypothetical protein PKJ26_03520 [Candidatus Woesebacteria bacterium]|nr:hypothetical protein [Candidatus Woesebacteria bacterium]HNS65539.1 hypothetical protein [Candidatus Woesebacteria bacterium]
MLEASRNVPQKPVLRLNLGGEGEILGCIQVNLPYVLEAGDNFVASRNGDPIGIKGVLRGGPLVICDSDRLPFLPGVFDEIFANGVPIDRTTWLGPGYSGKEICRVCKHHSQKPCDACHHGIFPIKEGLI